jgi:putative DNA primase/helicase
MGEEIIYQSTHEYLLADGAPAFSVTMKKEKNAAGKVGKSAIVYRMVDGTMVKGMGDEFANGNRPLYRLPQLAGAKLVFITEGERKCERLQQRLGDYAVATCYSGGAQGWSKTDFTPLIGKRVVVCADNDTPGIKAAHGVVDLLHDLGIKAAAFLPDAAFVLNVVPEKWDVGDEPPEGVTEQVLLEKLKAAMDAVEAASYIPLDDIDETIAAIESETSEKKFIQNADSRARSSKKYAELDFDKYFKPMGYAGNYYHFLKKQGMIKIDRRVGDLIGGHTFLELIPDKNFWVDICYKADSLVNNKPDWEGLSIEMVNRCHNKGNIQDQDERGFGAWRDGKDIVQNRLTGLTVNNNATDAYYYKSPNNYFYNCEPSYTGFKDPKEPIADYERELIINLVKTVRWEKEISGDMLAGWLMNAVIPGMLDWRPHIWMSGNKGTGKSKVMEKIISPILGPFCKKMSHSTTLPGVLQEISGASISIVMDEMESNSDKAKRITAEMVDVARKVSSDAGYRRVTSPNGKKRIQSCVSMMCFISISVVLAQASDRSRFTVLPLRIPADKSKMSMNYRLMEELSAAIPRDLGEKIYYYMLEHWEIHQKNIQMFAEVFTVQHGDQRAGDQYGTLLAGRWILENPRLVTKAEAINIVTRDDYSYYLREEATDSEDNQVLEHIGYSRIRVDTSSGPREYQVYNLFSMAFGRMNELEAENMGIIKITDTRARAALAQYGIYCDTLEQTVHFLVTDREGMVGDLLKGSPFGTGWASILSRHEGATRQKKRVQYIGKIASVITISIDHILTLDAGDYEAITQHEENKSGLYN